MDILVINCGSSSIKYQLFDTVADTVLARGGVERIGSEGAFISHRAGEAEYQHAISIPTHHEAFELIMEALVDPQHGAVSDVSSIRAVGHRIVHGGDKLVDSCLVTPEVVEELQRCIPIAPLHTPAHLIGIRESLSALPGIPNVLVFDTAFHTTMPPKAAFYPLPREYAEVHKVRKYGFHGSSYRFVSKRTAEVLGRPLDELKMVVCHLGNGASMAAIDRGVCVDTSMGLTPLEGLMMGTRCGDIDPAVVLFLQRQMGFSPDRVDTLLNKESGLLGVSGYSQDLRDVVARAQEGDEACQLAVEMFAYRVKKYVGAYAAAMDGIDVLVFTAGIGENAPVTRRLVCGGLSFLGIELDEELNVSGPRERVISTPRSRVSVLIVPTDEERIIVEDTLRIARETTEVA